MRTDRAEDEVAVLEDDAEDLFEHAPCGYLSVLADGTIVRVNQTLLGWVGYERADLVDRRRLADLLSPGGQIYFETHLRPMLRTQGTFREIALEMVCADGRRLPVLVNAAVKEARPDGPALTRLTVLDVTERRRYEQELIRARGRTERLQRLTSAVAATADRAEIGAAIVEEVTTGGIATGCVLAVLDRSGGPLTLVANGGVPDIVDGWARVALEDGTPTAHALSSMAPVFGTIDAGARLLFGSVPAEGIIAAIPLVAERSAIGVLCAVTDASGFAPDDRSFLIAVAEQAAQAFDRARLVELTTIAAERAGFLADTGRALEEAQTVAERIRRLLDLVVPRLADHASLELPERQGSRRERGEPPIEIGAEGELSSDIRLALGRATATGAPQLLGRADTDAHAEPADERGRALLAGGAARSFAGLPLRARGRVIGTMLLASSGVRTFRSEDLPFLSALADQAGLALENAQLYENERNISSALQRSMIAGTLPDEPGARLSVEYRPGVRDMQVGGDWYDAFMVGPRRMGIVVGDVVGRGLSAAAVMGQLRSALRALARAGLGVEAVVEHLDLFASDNEGANLATVVYAEIELDSGAMRWCCAGHPPPLLSAPRRKPEMLWEGRSVPLGLRTGSSLRTAGERTLSPGSRLLLYTDGLVERRGESIDAGLERLVEQMRRSEPSPAAGLARELADAMVGGDIDGRDDVCLLSLAFQASGP